MDFPLVTAQAPVNIAVIKYWGKRNEDLILPINDSISVTLSRKEMCATTTVACSEAFEKDRMWLNGKEQDMSNPRLRNCIREIRSRAAKKSISPILQWPVHICSENNFPTAAGLASSAAGYACLVYALGSLFDLKEDLSLIARQGSGSACRSMYGGFVHWHMGKKEDGSDSIARQIAPKAHWPELRILILVVSDQKKETSSTSGMKRTLQTSELIHYRASTVVPRRVQNITEAILKRDFQAFSEITIKDSNQFHAVCLDTYPPIRYMNSISFSIVDMVHAYNSFNKYNKVAYTFDAGPNACLYLLEQDVPEIISLINHFFPSSDKINYVKGLPASEYFLSEDLIHAIDMEPKLDAVQFVINTKVGSGPKLVTDPTKHLLDERGFPK